VKKINYIKYEKITQNVVKELHKDKKQIHVHKNNDWEKNGYELRSRYRLNRGRCQN